MKTIAGLVLLFSLVQTVAAQEYTVNLKPGRQLILGTLVSGVVREVKVQPGQEVKQGDVLLKLDQREFQAQLRRAKALIARANSLFEEARREEERAGELYDRTLLSDHELQKARIDRLEAESRKYDAAADLMQAKLNLERSAIVAPTEGRVLEVQAWPGQPLQNSLEIQPLIMFAATDTLQFTLLLPGQSRVSGVQVWRDGEWRKVSRFRLVPMKGKENDWLLQGWVESPDFAVGQKVKVLVE
ncbi:efflux RND transporter periplasmic adaptor subunit [Thiolapillus sp.]